MSESACSARASRTRSMLHRVGGGTANHSPGGRGGGHCQRGLAQLDQEHRGDAAAGSGAYHAWGRTSPTSRPAVTAASTRAAAHEHVHIRSATGAPGPEANPLVLAPSTGLARLS